MTTGSIDTVSRADVCAAAVADAFKDDGEIFGSPMGIMPMLGVRLAESAEQIHVDGVPVLAAGFGDDHVRRVDVRAGAEH